MASRRSNGQQRRQDVVTRCYHYHRIQVDAATSNKAATSKRAVSCHNSPFDTSSNFHTASSRVAPSLRKEAQQSRGFLERCWRLPLRFVRRCLKVSKRDATSKALGLTTIPQPLRIEQHSVPAVQAHRKPAFWFYEEPFAAIDHVMTLTSIILYRSPIPYGFRDVSTFLSFGETCPSPRLTYRPRSVPPCWPLSPFH